MDIIQAQVKLKKIGANQIKNLMNKKKKMRSKMEMKECGDYLEIFTQKEMRKLEEL